MPRTVGTHGETPAIYIFLSSLHSIFDPVNASLAVPANLCPSPQVLNSPAAHRKRKTRRPVENPQERKFHVKFLVNAFAEWIMRQACRFLFYWVYGGVEGTEEQPAESVDLSTISWKED